MDKILELYMEVYREKVKIMTGVLKGDRFGAEDIVQEAFTRALKFEKSYDPNAGDIKAWFNSILFNALRDYKRTERGYSVETTKDISVDDVMPEEYVSKISDGHLKKMVEDTILNLPNDRHKKVLYLFFILGYTSSEIAQIEAGVSQTNVTTIVNRFKESLKYAGKRYDNIRHRDQWSVAL